MVVYLLYSNWMHNGDNAVNEVIGVYDCLRKAQQALANCINLDLQYHPYSNVKSVGGRELEDYFLPELATMFYDDPNFEFDVTSVKLWNGEHEECCEDFQEYNIEEHKLL